MSIKIKLLQALAISAVLAIAGVMGTVGTSSAMDSQQNEMLSAAKSAESNRDFVKATRIYTKAAENPELQGIALSSLAQMNLRRGLVDEAKESIAAYLVQNPFSLEARLTLVDVYLAERNTDQAMKEVQRAVALRPDHMGTQERLGAILYEQRKFEESLPIIERLARYNPGSYSIKIKLARNYLAVNRVDAATNLLREAIQDRPNDVDAHNFLADLYFSEKKFGEAEKVYRYILKLDPNSETGLLRMGEIRAMANANDEAIEFYKRAIDLHPQNLEVGLRVGRLYRKSNQNKQAEGEFRRELAVNSGYEPAAQELYQILLEQKRLDRAGSFLGDYTEKNPQSFWAGSVYSKLLLQIDQPEAAERIVARLLKAGENSPELHVTQARAAERLGRKDEAVEILVKAEKKFPKEDEVKFQLGRIYEERGNFKTALEKYSQVSPESPIYRKVRDQVSELNSKISSQSTNEQDRSVANASKPEAKKSEENTHKDGN